MSIRAQGSIFSIGSGTGSPETFSAVGEVTGWQGFDGEAKTLDVTTLDSTSVEKWVGLNDEGTLSLDLNLNFGDAGQTAMHVSKASGAKHNMKLAIPAGPAGTPSGAAASGATLITFAGYVKGFSLTGQKDSIITAKAKIEITGAITITTS
jgi:Lambda phage tail tube protein, TTP